jgi:hypothetical protein
LVTPSIWVPFSSFFSLCVNGSSFFPLFGGLAFASPLFSLLLNALFLLFLLFGGLAFASPRSSLLPHIFFLLSCLLTHFPSLFQFISKNNNQPIMSSDNS